MMPLKPNHTRFAVYVITQTVTPAVRYIKPVSIIYPFHVTAKIKAHIEPTTAQDAVWIASITGIKSAAVIYLPFGQKKKSCASMTRSCRPLPFNSVSFLEKTVMISFVPFCSTRNFRRCPFFDAKTSPTASQLTLNLSPIIISFRALLSYNVGFGELILTNSSMAFICLSFKTASSMMLSINSL